MADEETNREEERRFVMLSQTSTIRIWTPEKETTKKTKGIETGDDVGIQLEDIHEDEQSEDDYEDATDFNDDFDQIPRVSIPVIIEEDDQESDQAAAAAAKARGWMPRCWLVLIGYPYSRFDAIKHAVCVSIIVEIFIIIGVYHRPAFGAHRQPVFWGPGRGMQPHNYQIMLPNETTSNSLPIMNTIPDQANSISPTSVSSLSSSESINAENQEDQISARIYAYDDALIVLLIELVVVFLFISLIGSYIESNHIVISYVSLLTTGNLIYCYVEQSWKAMTLLVYALSLAANGIALVYLYYLCRTPHDHYSSSTISLI